MFFKDIMISRKNKFEFIIYIPIITQKPQKINLRFLCFLSVGNVLQKLSLRVQPFSLSFFVSVYYLLGGFPCMGGGKLP